MAGPGTYIYGDEERKEIMDVLSSGNFSRYGVAGERGYGHKVYKFEQEFAELCSANYALATNSGTSSLLVALLALGIGDGDEVLVSGYTYVASISAIVYSRATPVLVEIDESLTIDPADIENKITAKTKAIMPVHMLGNPCKMSEIMEIAKKHNLYVIEDCCQAAGATYRGKRVGTFGDIGVFSLNRYKTIATGDGGALVTNNKDLYERAFAIHDQGHRPIRASKDASGDLIGLNLKMNELTGAVALAQVRKLDPILKMLRDKKQTLKRMIEPSNIYDFRELNDDMGECATLLTLVFNEVSDAKRFAATLGQSTLINSGWHVYKNMNQISAHRTPSKNWSPPARYAQYGELPRTEDLLSRSVNISIGVVDVGLGAGYGINILSSEDEVATVAKRINIALTVLEPKD